MIYLVNGSSVARHSSRWLGQLISPRCRNRIVTSPWAADNGAFSGFDAGAWFRMIERLPAGGLFCALPDVVGDARATDALWREYRSQLPDRFVAAYVAQDGCAAIPGDARALFVGGSTAFKLSRQARSLVDLALARGLWVHMGRVNTRRRVLLAHRWGCHSVDGTCASRWPDFQIPRIVRWLEYAHAQQVLL